MIVDPLSSRTISTYPLSIGTSLAMESIAAGSLPAYDEQRHKPEEVNLLEYSSVYINLATLHRNLLGSVGAEVAQSIKASDIAQTLSEEVEIIREIIHSHSQHPIKLVFYLCGHEKLISEYPHANLRSYSTDRQKSAQKLLQDCLSIFFTKYTDLHTKDARNPCTFVFTHKSLSIPKPERVLIVTHHAIDLLEHRKVQRLDLLESHTGVLKTLSAFHTKFCDGKELVRIPFLPAMLVIFGDTQTFIPWKKSIRQEIIEIAKVHEWNYKTTSTRARVNLGDLKDILSKKIILSMV